MPETPKRELVLAELVAILGTIEAGDDYFMTPNMVTRRRDNALTQAAEYVFVVLPGDETYSTVSVSGVTVPVPAGFLGRTLEVTIFFERQNVDPEMVPLVESWILHDIEKAMMLQDEKVIGGVKVRILPLRNVVEYGDFTQSRIMGNIVFAVSYRTPETDPSRAT